MRGGGERGERRENFEPPPLLLPGCFACTLPWKEEEGRERQGLAYKEKEGVNALWMVGGYVVSLSLSLPQAE